MQVNFPKADLDSDVTFDTEASKACIKKTKHLRSKYCIGGGAATSLGWHRNLHYFNIKMWLTIKY